MGRRTAAVGAAFLLVLAPLACGDDEAERPEALAPVADDGAQTRSDIRAVAGLPTLVVQPQGGGPFPLVLFVHGAGAPPEFYEGLLTELAAEGNVVVAPAMPGSVDDAGLGALQALPFQPGRVRQVIDAVTEGGQAIPAADPERVVLVGHSLGAMTALATAFNTCCVDQRVDAVVSIAGQLATFPGGVWNTGLVPVLLVHGRLDDTVAYAGSGEALQELGPSAYLLTVEEGDHGGYLSRDDTDYPAVRDAILAFMLSTVGDQPQAGLADLATAGGSAGVRLTARG